MDKDQQSPVVASVKRHFVVMVFMEDNRQLLREVVAGDPEEAARIAVSRDRKSGSASPDDWKARTTFSRPRRGNFVVEVRHVRFPIAVRTEVVEVMRKKRR